MYEMLKDVTCVVTAFISFLYGARVAWGFGRKSVFKENQDHRIQFLFESVPAAAVLFFVGFLIVYSYLISSAVTLAIVSLTSALLLSLLVVALSMPDLKRINHGEGVVVELVDGTVCRLAKDTFNYYLATGKVAKFKREGAWTVVGEDPLRQATNDTVYVGIERRCAG